MIRQMMGNKDGKIKSGKIPEMKILRVSNEKSRLCPVNNHMNNRKLHKNW